MIILLMQNDATFSIQHLYQKFSLPLLKYAYSLLKSYDKAEDAVQETFLRIKKCPPDFEKYNEKQIKSFLITATKWSCSSILEEREHENIDDLEIASNLEIHDLFDYTETKTFLEGEIKRLSKRDQQIFYLKFVHNMSNSEIGTIVNMTPNHVAVRIHRIRNELMVSYAGYCRG